MNRAYYSDSISCFCALRSYEYMLYLKNFHYFNCSKETEEKKNHPDKSTIFFSNDLVSWLRSPFGITHC